MLVKEIKDNNGVIETAECRNCCELFAIILMFTEKADDECHCNMCKQNLSEQETKEEHISKHHATCCLRCKSALYAKTSYKSAKNNKGKVGVVVGAVVAPALLPVVGFTAAGVTGGSVAAGVQSAVYGAYTTGVFSVLQSAGTGAVVATGAVITGGGTVGGLMGKCVAAVTGGNMTSSSDEPTDRDDANGNKDADNTQKTHECKNAQ
jgi:hypothetical protein